jgi:hypothetical protein
VTVRRNSVLPLANRGCQIIFTYSDGRHVLRVVGQMRAARILRAAGPLWRQAQPPPEGWPMAKKKAPKMPRRPWPKGK